MDIDLLIAGIIALLTFAGGLFYMEQRVAPALGAARELVDMIGKCRSARADGTVTEYEEQMIGRAAVRFTENLETAGRAIFRR
jgi:hypothetical protein